MDRGSLRTLGGELAPGVAFRVEGAELWLGSSRQEWRDRPSPSGGNLRQHLERAMLRIR